MGSQNVADRQADRQMDRWTDIGQARNTPLEQHTHTKPYDGSKDGTVYTEIRYKQSTIHLHRRDRGTKGDRQTGQRGEGEREGGKGGKGRREG